MWASIGQFLKDYGELISITLIPFILWFMGIKFQDRAAKRKAKEDLFLTLMANRRKSPPSEAKVDALNQIDIIFQDNKAVRSAWLAYFDSLHQKSQHFENQNSFHLDLLSEIAKDLGYKDLRQTELDRVYTPQHWGDKFEKEVLMNKELYRILLKSKSFSSEFSDEEKEDKRN